MLGTGAGAVSLSENGSGQALILPYYTVNGGNSTLLSLRNSTDAVKAVRIRFREGRNGAPVLDFNIYLAPHDTWTGAVVGDAEGPARISRSDKTCTVPLLPDVPQPFFNFAYSPPSFGDGGPYHLERTREGFVEFIEMGEVFDDADGGFRPATAATPVRTQSNENENAPANCQVLHDAWSIPDGLWLRKPHRNIRSPAGGLSANAVIVNAAQGSSFSVPALALSEFFSPAGSCAPGCDGLAGQNLHDSPGYIFPDLSSARDADGGATALIRHAGQSYRFRFEGEGAGARAVTALLMRRSLSNEFNAAQAALLSSNSEWVLTQPTRYLLQRGASASTRLPFRAAYRGSNVAPYSGLQGACEATLFEHWGRDGRPPSRGGSFGLPPPTPPPPQLCWTTQVLAFNQAGVGDVLRGGQPSRVLGARYAAPVRPCLQPWTSASTSCTDAATMFEAGSARISFPDDGNFLYASTQPIADNPGGANLLTGLPVIGFWVSNFAATGTPGVLANFAVQQPHSSQLAPRVGTVQVDSGGNPSWTPQP
jgi:hypothetical protein